MSLASRATSGRPCLGSKSRFVPSPTLICDRSSGLCSRRVTVSLLSPAPVSYTHLRAHETSAHL
eukprot:4202799-Alexandrium_andersonii.AAC.1